MILLYSYTHWFWITILVVCTSDIFSQKESKEMHLLSNDSEEISPERAKPVKGELFESNVENVSVIEATASITYLNTSNLSLDVENLTTIESFREGDNESKLLSSDRMESNCSGPLSAAGITSITLGCVIFVGIVSAASYLWYRNRSLNRPQVLSDHCSNLDSSGYIDDISDNSEEMYSLDNDSFLNSLEAMTIQNYWTDTVKHTKL